jgi:hypothetical protein
VSSPTSLVKCIILGRPFRSDRIAHTLLPKRIALAIFASDPLSSVAYATQEILLILTLGALSYLYLTPWSGAAVVILPGRAATWRPLLPVPAALWRLDNLAEPIR